jgi:hypothetical protein
MQMPESDTFIWEPLVCSPVRGAMLLMLTYPLCTLVHINKDIRRFQFQTFLSHLPQAYR